MNILLPVCTKSSCKPVYATVKAEGGCFQWKVEDTSLVNLELVPTPSDNTGCVHKVLVSPKTNQVNSITWLIATDKKYNEEFKCKIGFAEVHQIEISTRFDTNNVGELFELQVEARDSKGNLFSSLEGWSFNWTIDNLSIAELKKSIDENKKVSPKRKEIEQKNNHSDVVLVKGKTVGKITVTCRIMERDLDRVSSMKQLYIVDPFSISPSVIYIMPKNTIDLHIEYLSKAKINQNDMKSYDWNVDDTECGSVTSDGKFTSKDIICTTEIIVNDRRITDNNTAKAIVHVVYPDQIKIGYITIGELSERNNLKTSEICKECDVDYKHEKVKKTNEILLIEGHEYFIKYFIFYQSNPVFAKDNFKFDKTEYPQSPQKEMEYCNSRHNSFILKPQTALTKRESIKAVLQLESNQFLSEEKSLMIHSKIKINKFGMKYFTLPYLGFSENPSSPKYVQELRLDVTGGSTHYNFNSTNDRVIRILNNVLFGQELGTANITAYDKENEENFDQMEVRVSQVRDMTYLERKQEIEVNRQFDVAVIGVNNEDSKGSNKDSIEYYINTIFTNCTKLISDAQIEQNDIIESHNLHEGNDINNMANVKSYLDKSTMLLNTIESLYNLNLTHKEYLSYANYGICNINSFKGKAAGISYISYKINNDQSKDSTTFSTKAGIRIFKEMSLKHSEYDEYTKAILAKSSLDDPYLTKHISLLHTNNKFYFEIENGLTSWDGIDHNVQIKNKDKLKYNDNNKRGEIICNSKSYTATVDILIQAKESLILPRPAQSKLELYVNCQNRPKSTSIFFLSSIPEGNINETYFIPQDKIRYYLANNTTEIVRLYGFDENKTMILNFKDADAGIKPDIYSKVYHLIKKEDFEKNNKRVPKDSGEFLQQYAHFYPIGNSQLHFQFTLEPILDHFAHLFVIEPPVLKPKTATIYISEENSFEFTIINGSGKDYKVIFSDNDLGSYSFDNSYTKLIIKPKKKTGVLGITLIETKIKGSPSDTATLYLADVKDIKLNGGGLLMMNKTLSIGVEVIDTFGNQFTNDQLNKIPLVIDETYDKTSGLSISYSNSHYRTISSPLDVTGIASGTYPITVTVSNIRSNTITIEVFDRLNVFPPYLLLIPGSTYTLSITGGPRNTKRLEIKYRSLNPEIASIGTDIPQVTAKKKGNTTAIIELIYNNDYDKIYNDEINDKHIHNNRTTVLCNETVPVRVEIPTDIKILGASERQIFTQSTIRLLTAFKLNNETFTYGIGNMTFNWEVENKESGQIITFSKDKVEEEICNSQNDDTCVQSIEDKGHSIGIFFQSKQEGIIKILLNVKIIYPKEHIKEHSKDPTEFTTSENVKVNDQIYVDINEFYGQNLMKSTIYMIPFNVDHELHTSKKTVQHYSIESSSSSDANSIITLTKAGRITTNSNTGRVYVKITNTEKDKNMLPVLLPIYVTDFYSLFVEKTNILNNLKIGQEINLSVILQHDSGKLFAEVFERMQLKVVESNPQVAKAELINHSSKLKLKALDKGQTHIILFHPETRKIYDVFKITVSNKYYSDSAVLHVGGTIRFMGKNKEKLKRITANPIWSSNDTSILHIDSKTGVATGKGEGVALVLLKTSDDIIKKKITVYVGKVNNIYVDKTKLPPLLTNMNTKPNANDKVEYSIPVDFDISTDDKKLQFEDLLNEIEHNIQFKCESNTPSIAKAFGKKSNTKTNTNTNSYYECVISMQPDINNQKAIPSEIEIKFAVYTMANKEIYSKVEQFAFVSSFNIKVDRISIASKGKPYRVEISGHMNNLDCTSDRSLIECNVYKDKGYIELTVPDSVQGPFQDVPINVKDTLTNQEKKIIASFRSQSSQRAMFLGLIPMDTIVDTITLILLIVIIVILIIYLSSPKEQTRPMQGTTSYSNQRYSGPKGSGLRSNDYNSHLKAY